MEQRYAKARKFKEILVYYGDIWRDEEHEDMQYADKSKDELRSMPFISWMDFIYQTDAQYLASWRDLAKLTSVGDSDMSFILQDMISHFADGTGTDYTDPILTQKVEEHQVTQNYMRDFTEDVYKRQITSSVWAEAGWAVLGKALGPIFLVLSLSGDMDQRIQERLAEYEKKESCLLYTSSLLQADCLLFQPEGQC